jgi:hypothetical protein
MVSKMLDELRKLSIMFVPSAGNGLDRWILPMCGYILICTILMFLAIVFE